MQLSFVPALIFEVTARGLDIYPLFVNRLRFRQPVRSECSLVSIMTLLLITTCSGNLDAMATWKSIPL